MMQHPPKLDPIPDNCFRQSELEAFQSLENQPLEIVNYYLWQVQGSSGFLYALELYFSHGETLLLSCGEDSDAIRVISAASLVETARKLQEIHGVALMQRMAAHAQPLWEGALGQALQGIRLSRQENGLYANDALLLDFGSKRIFVQLSEKEGLELGVYD